MCVRVSERKKERENKRDTQMVPEIVPGDMVTISGMVTISPYNLLTVCRMC